MEDNNYDWKKAAIHDFEHSGMSLQEIADKYARNRVTVQKLIAREGVERATPLQNKGGRTPFDQQHAISPLHKNIGVEINLHRTMKRKENLTEFANAIMTNRYRLARMELGLHDFSLSELCRIAQVLSISPTALMETKKEAIYRNP